MEKRTGRTKKILMAVGITVFTAALILWVSSRPQPAPEAPTAPDGSHAVYTENAISDFAEPENL